MAGQRAAAIMSLIQSAKLNGHDPYNYLKDVLMRLPSHLDRDIGELLPHRWKPSVARDSLRPGSNYASTCFTRMPRASAS